MENPKNAITYELCGIKDIKTFYRSKFASPTVYEKSDLYVFRYDISYLKQNFVIDFIRPNGRVLDFGCGSGPFGVLKKLNCELTGVDYSEEALFFAKNLNHYDHVICEDIFHPTFDQYLNYFDYILSLDVLGHIEFRQKDRVLQRLKELLKPEGVMIHGIEAEDIDYLSMSQEELKKYVSVDGHIGIEPFLDITKRFDKYFKYVEAYNLFVFNSDFSEVIKQNDVYHRKYENELIYYLRGMANNKAFVEGFIIAQYLAQYTITETELNLSHYAGYCFILASDRKVIKHRQHLPRPKIRLSSDFYGPEKRGENYFRWSPPKSTVFLNAVRGISIHLSSYFPR